MHLAISPVLLCFGEWLLNGIDLPALGYACTEHVASPLAIEGLPCVQETFDLTGLRAAILDSQTREQKFKDFSRRAMSAGIQSYYAFLRGKRVTYLGRQGDQHVEWFPGAAPTDA